MTERGSRSDRSCLTRFWFTAVSQQCLNSRENDCSSYGLWLGKRTDQNGYLNNFTPSGLVCVSEGHSSMEVILVILLTTFYFPSVQESFLEWIIHLCSSLSHFGVILVRQSGQSGFMYLNGQKCPVGFVLLMCCWSAVCWTPIHNQRKPFHK